MNIESTPVGAFERRWPPPGYDLEVFFWYSVLMSRVSFLIDGFNLYHSARELSKDRGLKGRGTKWLNIHSLCVSYLPLFGRQATLQEVYYFSALAKHIQAVDPDVTKRHRKFIRCLEATGVTVELSRFRKKRIYCPSCKQVIKRHEEKETDVAISVKLLELFMLNKCDAVVIMTGDTDIAPAFRTAQRLFPSKAISFAFPYARKNNELLNLAATSFRVSASSYLNHQFPDPFVLPDGTKINKPPKW